MKMFKKIFTSALGLLVIVTSTPVCLATQRPGMGRNAGDKKELKKSESKCEDLYRGVATNKNLEIYPMLKGENNEPVKVAIVPAPNLADSWEYLDFMNSFRMECGNVYAQGGRDITYTVIQLNKIDGFLSRFHSIVVFLDGGGKGWQSLVDEFSVKIQNGNFLGRVVFTSDRICSNAVGPYIAEKDAVFFQSKGTLAYMSGDWRTRDYRLFLAAICSAFDFGHSQISSLPSTSSKTNDFGHSQISSLPSTSSKTKAVAKRGGIAAFCVSGALFVAKKVNDRFRKTAREKLRMESPIKA